MSKVMMMMLMVFALTSSLAAAEGPTAVGFAKDGSEFNLHGAKDVATYVVGDSTFAIVAAGKGDGVQIIDVSDPSLPVAAGSATDGSAFTTLGGASFVATYVVGDSTYAIVTAYNDNGVQIIDVSNPSSPQPMGTVTDAQSVHRKLSGPKGVATYVVGDSTFAIVASSRENGVQIIDVSNPSSPQAMGTATDGSVFEKLKGASFVATYVVGDSTFAIVAALSDNGVQIIDVSNPSSPQPMGTVTDGSMFKVNLPVSVSTYAVGDSTYAIVTAYGDDGVQIIDVSNPSSPVAAGSATDGSAFQMLKGAYGVATYVVGGSTYAIVTALSDNGVQMIHLADPPPTPGPTPSPSDKPTPSPSDTPTPGPTTNPTSVATDNCASKLYLRYAETSFKVETKVEARKLIAAVKKAFKAIKESYRAAKSNLRKLGREAKE